MILRRSGRLLGALFMAMCFISPGWAQWASSGLTGTVSDSSGHGLAGVEVTAVQDATGLQRKLVSSAEGAYYFSKLPVGSYTVTFDRQNFQSLRFDNVAQKLAETRVLNVTLKIAAPTEQVEVLSSPVSLDQTNNTLSTGLHVYRLRNCP